MSDISKKIFSIDPEPDEEPIALIPEPIEDEILSDAAEPEDMDSEIAEDHSEFGLQTDVDIPTTIFRPIIELVDPEDDDPEDEDDLPPDTELSEPPITLMRPDQIVSQPNEAASDMIAVDMIAPIRPSGLESSYDTPSRFGWIGPLLAVLTATGVGALAYAYIQEVETVSAIGLAGLVMAVFVSTATTMMLWVSLRALGRTQSAAMQLATISDRLTHADETVTADISRMSSAIRRELAQVDSRLAQSRRELSIMEGELRALQSRMDGAKSMDLVLDIPETKQTPPSGRLNLKPLDSDFPPFEPDTLAIPEPHEDQTLDLIEPLKLPVDMIQPQPSTSTLPDPDLIRRSSGDASLGRMFERAKKDEQGEEDWRWRDIVSAVDPIAKDVAKAEHSGIDRPPPGVPLSPPPPEPKLPDGSDIIARLCEVELAPSAVVDQGTIIDATEARHRGGEAAQSEIVFSRLNAPVIHLRSILSNDLEFRLRAENFRRNFDTYFQSQRDQTKIRSELQTASGRAYLLCAAALTAS